MTRKTSAWLAYHGANCMFSTSLGSPDTGELPFSKMSWGSLPSSDQNWPTGDLDNYNRFIQLVGKRPASVRMYRNGSAATGTTGVSGSAGTYGLITPDGKAISNAGTALCITFKLSDARGWAAETTALGASGSNQTKTDIANVAQNVRRWVNDTGNTSPVKKLMLGMHHEPSNDGQPASEYVAWWRAIVDEMRSNGVGSGARPASYTGSASWIDGVEWTFVDIGTTFSGGSNAFYPGLAYVDWVMADPYNWAGGQYANVCKAGKVAQPGDNIETTGFTPNNHYAQAWSTFKQTVQNVLDWSDNNPDPLLGLGEFSTFHDVDRWTKNSSGVLVTPQTHTGIPTAAGEWYRQIPRVCAGLASETGVNTLNQYTADTRGRRLKCIHAWPSQDKAPRWINQKAWAPGDVSTPTASGTWTLNGVNVGNIGSSMLDGFKTAANDAWFTSGGGGGASDPPSGVTIGAAPNPDDSSVWLFTGTATPGTASLSSWEWAFGDGASATTQDATHTYTTTGTYTVQLTVTDSASLTASASQTVNVVVDTGGGGGGGGGGGPVVANYTYIRSGDLDRVADFRVLYNLNLTKQEVVNAAISARLDTLEGGSGGGATSVGTPVAGALVEDTTVSTSTAIPYPAGISAGHLLVAFMSHSSLTVATNPSGWTQVYSSIRGAALPALWVGIKFAAGSESGSLAVAHTSSVAIGGMMRVPGVNQTTPQDATATTVQNATAGTTTVLPGVTTTRAGGLLIAVACQNSNTSNASTVATSSGTWTEDADRVSGTRAATMWHSARPASGSSGDATITWTGTATSHGVLIALRAV